MENIKVKFAQRLREAMLKAGYAPKPAVLEREFNLRNWGKPITLHGVRRWLRGETLPTEDKLLVLAEWLKVAPEKLRYGIEVEERINEHQKLWERLNHQEKATLEAFISLPASQRKIVREVVLAFARSSGTEEDGRSS